MTEEQKDQIMEIACELCRFPFELGQEELDSKCDNCPMLTALNDIERG